MLMIAMNCVAGVVSNFWCWALWLVAGTAQDDEGRICCRWLRRSWSHIQWDRSARPSSAC